MAPTKTRAHPDYTHKLRIPQSAQDLIPVECWCSGQLPLKATKSFHMVAKEKAHWELNLCSIQAQWIYTTAAY